MDSDYDYFDDDYGGDLYGDNGGDEPDYDDYDLGDEHELASFDSDPEFVPELRDTSASTKPTPAAPMANLVSMLQPAIAHVTPVPKVDTTRYKQQLLSLILRAVLSNHSTAPVEKALQTLKKDCDIDNHPVGTQLLDFVAENFPQVRAVPQEYRFHTPLMVACEKERPDLVRLLIEKGASVAFKNKDALNAVHIACNKGNVEIVVLLLEAVRTQRNFTRKKVHLSDLTVALNARNQRGWTPLMYAVKGGHVEVIDRLVETGEVDYERKNKKQCNILHIACGAPQLECVKRVFQLFKDNSDKILATDKNGWNFLHHVCAIGSTEILEWLLSQISEQNRNTLLNQQTKAGYTPLLVACDYQKEEILKLLLAREVDVALCAKDREEGKKTFKDEGSKSGLHLAAIHDSREIAQRLIEKGCPLATQDSEGNSPLHVAYKKSSFEVITVLRQADDGTLERLTNKDGKIATEVIPEDVIPPEIKKRGKEAVDLYKKALREGKKKIPRCNLLILGEQRVGKTSVYRLLVGLTFNPKQDPTKGIDNNEVETVDIRPLSMEQWEVISKEQQQEKSDEQFADGVVDSVRSNLPQEEEEVESFKPVPEEQLLQEVVDITAQIESERQQVIIRAQQEADQLAQRMEQMRINPPSRVPSQPQRQLPRRPEVEIPPPNPVAPRAYDPPRPAPPTRQVPKPNEPPTQPTHVPRTVPASQDPPSVPPEASMDESDAPSASDEPTPAQEPVLTRMSRRQSRTISKMWKSKQPREEKEPSLIFNTLDFAGQKEYRPMHHCFITRRAIYIVAFNLQDMVKYLEARRSQNESMIKPLEELRYWLHSIHAHIYPPDEKERGDDQKMKRVCLVGTHRAPKDPRYPEHGRLITDQELSEINELFKEELINDDRCVNHLHFVESEPGRIFAAVENSIDSKDAEERKESGAKALQDELKSISSHLSFLQEDYPIVWLQFESELMRQRELQKERSSSMVVKLEELRKIAVRQGIVSPEGQDLAFQFFHDIGKIVYHKRTPTLFLNEEEKEQLSDLVILDPAWLIKVIKEIIELKMGVTKCRDVRRELIRDLDKTGIASSTLLRTCWSKFFTDSLSFHQLCLMLQANCLIYPVRSPPTLERAESEPTPEGGPPSTPPPSRSQTEPKAETEEEQLYLVPCRLPDKTETPKSRRLPWISFYFDFQKFLPEEIFHRFICLMLQKLQDTCQGVRGSKKKPNVYSNTCCEFYNINDCHWKIELERHLHRIKVSFISAKQGGEPLSQYITKIHKDFLQRICKDSNLQGLEYCGGPLVKCKQCGGEEILGFVRYEDGKSKAPLSQCSFCFQEEYDVEHLLKLQVKANNEARGAESDGKRQAPQARLSADGSQDQPYTAVPKTPTDVTETTRLSLRSLTLMKWIDVKGETQKLRILRHIAPKWKEAGRLLGFEHPEIQVISKRNFQDPEDCCSELLSKWFETKDVSPVSWKDVIELLEDLELARLAKELEEALKQKKVAF